MKESQETKNLLKVFEKGYRITDEGEIISPFNRKLRPQKQGRYLCLCSRIDGKYFKVNIHRIQAYQKYGECIFEKGVHIRHFDNNPHNNNKDNILLGNASSNALDIPIAQRKEIFEKIKNTKLKKSKSKEKGEYAIKYGAKEAAVHFNNHISYIYKLIKKIK